MKLGFVIPTYNRSFNLELALTGLQQQTYHKFSVAIWDDGSEDDGETTAVSQRFAVGMDIRYGWHKHAGYRVSLNRNRGVRLLDPDTTHIWFLDSDVVLNPNAVSHAVEHIVSASHVVIIGKYIWLPPMKVSVDDVRYRWDDFVACRLPLQKVDYVQDIMNRDPRKETIWDCLQIRSEIRGISLGGNLIVPMTWFQRTGGFDEKIEGQGQDCEFGYNLQAAGAQRIACAEIVGYHVAHYRDRKFLQDSVKETIVYIHEKYPDVIFKEEAEDEEQSSGS